MAIPRKLSDLSKQQHDFLKNSNAKVNICSGSVRSGKNFVENIRLIEYARFEPIADPTSDLFFCGETKDSVFRIFLEDMIKILGSAIYYNRHHGNGRIFGRNFYVFGFGKESDWERLRGSTGGGALVTEMTLCHPDFMKELEARCSVDGAQIFCDTNPDSPFHWVYTDYIVNKLKLSTGSVKVFYFNFDSNLHLKESYKDHLKITYKPGTLFYKRLILGLWVAAEGVVYDSFDSEKNCINPEDIPFCESYALVIDYGTSNPFVSTLMGLKDRKKYYAISHYYYNGKKDGQKTNGEYCDEIIDQLSDLPKKILLRLKTFVVDPSAAGFKAELNKNPKLKAFKDKHNLKIIVKNAKNTKVGKKKKKDQDEKRNDVIEKKEGIQLVSSLLHELLLFICVKCDEGLKEFPLYIWDKSAQNKGEDVPIKKHDHFLDTIRYGVNTPWIQGTGVSNWNK